MTDTKKTTKKTLKITLIGSEGTGKSAFLAGLAVLGLDSLNPQYRIAPHNNATSVYLNTLRESFIIHNAWPTPTLVTQLLDFDLTINRTKLNLVTIDYGGELFREAFNQMKPEDMQAFSDHLRQSEVLLFLVDAEEVVEAQNSGKQFALSEKLRANLTAVQESCKEFAKTNQDKFNEMELCIVLTKADRIPELAGAVEDSAIARAFGDKYFGKVLETKVDGIKTENIRYFAVSSIGKNALDPTSQSLIPGKIQPEGYNNLFTWISKRGTRRFNRWLVATMIFGLIVGVGIGVTCLGGKVTVDQLHEQHVREALQILQNPNVPVIDRLTNSEMLKINDKRVTDERQKLFESHKTNLLAELEKSHESKTIIELRDKIKSEKERIGGILWETDLQNILDKCNSQVEEIDYKEVTVLYENDKEDFGEKATAFLVNHPKSEHKSEIEEYIHQKKISKINGAKHAIAAIPVTPGTIQGKIDKINWYLTEFEKDVKDAEKEKIEKAVNMANTFKTKHQYTVKIISHGQFSSTRAQKIQIKINNQDVLKTDYKKAETVNLNRDFTFSWKYGEPIEFILLGYEGFGHWKYKEYASVRLDGFDALKAFSQSKIELNALRGEKYHGPDGFYIKFEQSRYTPEEWSNFEYYIAPGGFWEETK
ncbi:MAG: hypothetical protein Q4A17_05895 [Thermoguttaceae bacterium]|nr:hypothetical protein [Thermoguttaceae bacterium]